MAVVSLHESTECPGPNPNPSPNPKLNPNPKPDPIHDHNPNWRSRINSADQTPSNPDPDCAATPATSSTSTQPVLSIADGVDDNDVGSELRPPTEHSLYGLLALLFGLLLFNEGLTYGLNRMGSETGGRVRVAQDWRCSICMYLHLVEKPMWRYVASLPCTSLPCTGRVP